MLERKRTGKTVCGFREDRAMMESSVVENASYVLPRSIAVWGSGIHRQRAAVLGGAIQTLPTSSSNLESCACVHAFHDKGLMDDGKIELRIVRDSVVLRRAALWWPWLPSSDEFFGRDL